MEKKKQFRSGKRERIMIYHCGHQGCDVCGARDCEKVDLKKYFKDYILCAHCLRKAITLAIRMAEEFGGTIIDPDKKCGEVKGV